MNCAAVDVQFFKEAAPEGAFFLTGEGGVHFERAVFQKLLQLRDVLCFFGRRAADDLPFQLLYAAFIFLQINKVIDKERFYTLLLRADFGGVIGQDGGLLLRDLHLHDVLRQIFAHIIQEIFLDDLF